MERELAKVEQVAKQEQNQKTSQYPPSPPPEREGVGRTEAGKPRPRRHIIKRTGQTLRTIGYGGKRKPHSMCSHMSALFLSVTQRRKKVASARAIFDSAPI